MKVIVKCKCCQNNFESDTKETNRGNGLFCSRSCNTSYQNSNRILKKFNCKCCKKEFESKALRAKFCSRKCGNIYNPKIDKIRVNPLLGRSNLSKVVIRMSNNSEIINKCFNCNWDKSICDIHHIIPKSEGGLDVMENLTVLCPNCHRMIHRGLIESVLSVSDKIKQEALL